MPARLRPYGKNGVNASFQLALAVLIWAIFPLKLVLLILPHTGSIPTLVLFGTAFLSYFAGMIPLLPGGLGTFEATMSGILTAYGLALNQAVAVTVVFRFITFWFVLLLSLLVIGGYRGFFFLRRGGGVSMPPGNKRRGGELPLCLARRSLCLHVGNMLLGLTVLYLNIGKKDGIIWSSPCILILIAAVLDAFDGVTARLLGAESDFGKQFDSFADLISFGLAPMGVLLTVEAIAARPAILILLALYPVAGVLSPGPVQPGEFQRLFYRSADYRRRVYPSLLYPAGKWG